MMPILLMVSQPFRMTWKVVGGGTGSQWTEAKIPHGRWGRQRETLKRPPLPQLLEAWLVREGGGQTCPVLNHK